MTRQFHTDIDLIGPAPAYKINGTPLSTGGTASGTKLSALAALSALATTDLMELLDVSDTAMAATGTNKKVLLSDLITFLAANGLTSSATVTAATSGAGLYYGFDFDTTTTAGAATTRLRLNNATPASATAVYVSYTTKDGVDIKTRMLAGTAGDRLLIQDRDNSANYRIYELTGAPTDGTTYATVNVVHRGGGGSLWANNEGIVAGFTAPPITVASTAPTSPLTNDIWIDTT